MGSGRKRPNHLVEIGDVDIVLDDQGLGCVDTRLAMEDDLGDMTTLQAAFASEIGVRTAADGVVLRGWSTQRSMAIELDVV
nr:hypothetical protein [Nocardia albiluteola]